MIYRVKSLPKVKIHNVRAYFVLQVSEDFVKHRATVAVFIKQLVFSYKNYFSSIFITADFAKF